MNTIRRWIEADKIPAPYLRCTATGHRVYSVGELSVLVRHLAQHEGEYSYLVVDHSHVTETLHQAVHAYRSHDI